MITNERVLEGFAKSHLCSACSKLTYYVVDPEEWHQKRCGLKDQENLRRIHIIGGPGSGKTTLARKIGKCLEVEPSELDQIAFTGPDFEERPFSDRVADIYRIASRPAWITEGLFVLWTDQLLASANMIIWLDNVNWERGMWRITSRFIRAALHEVRSRQGLQRFARFQDYARHVKQFIQVFFSSRDYYAGIPSRSTGRMETRPNTAAFLKPYQEKVIHCRSDEAVESVLEYIRHCHSVHG